MPYGQLQDLTGSINISDYDKPQDVLESRLIKLERYLASMEKELRAFWTGNASENASLQEIILAKWGRKRLEAMSEAEGVYNPPED